MCGQTVGLIQHWRGIVALAVVLLQRISQRTPSPNPLWPPPLHFPDPLTPPSLPVLPLALSWCTTVCIPLTYREYITPSCIHAQNVSCTTCKSAITVRVPSKVTERHLSFCRRDSKKHRSSRLTYTPVILDTLHVRAVLTQSATQYGLAHFPLRMCKLVSIYKVVQIWPGQTVTCLHTNSPGHIWTTLYIKRIYLCTLCTTYVQTYALNTLIFFRHLCHLSIELIRTVFHMHSTSPAHVTSTDRPSGCTTRYFTAAYCTLLDLCFCFCSVLILLLVVASLYPVFVQKNVATTGKAAAAWSWPVTFTHGRWQEIAQLYLTSVFTDQAHICCT
jgi:hypothetical protein